MKISTPLVLSLVIISTLYATTPVDRLLDTTIHKKESAYAPTLNLIEHQRSRHELYAPFIHAVYLHKRGATKQSLAVFHKIIHRNPPAYVYEGYLSLLFEIGLFKKITELYEQKKEQIDTITQKNIDLKLIIAQAYLCSDQDDRALSLFASLVESFPDHEQVAYYAVVAYLKQNKIDTAQTIIQRSLNNPLLKNKHFLFHFLQSKIYLQQHNIQAARTAIDRSIELFPKFERAWLLKAMLLEQQGEMNDAINGYKHFLSLVGRDETIEKQLIQLLFNQEKYEEAALYLKKFEHTTPDYYFDLALTQFKAGQINHALSSVNKALHHNYQFTRALLLKTEILIAKKNSAELIAFLEEWLTHRKDDLTSLHTLLVLKNNKLSAKIIIHVLEEMAKKQAGSLHHVAMLADLYSETKQSSQALATYKNLLTQTNDQRIKAQIIYHIAHEYYMLKDQAGLAETINEAEKLHVVHPALNNLHAYFYAEQNHNLKKALTLIDEALAQEPTNPHFLDTKGFILLKQGLKPEARTLFHQALERSPHDTTIQEHLRATEF